MGTTGGPAPSEQERGGATSTTALPVGDPPAAPVIPGFPYRAIAGLVSDRDTT
ncbi:hypothetical protein ACIGW4_26010 [Streptomyces sp. NPDC053513]|uniref:hypothetical protein n=1 Tax=unclassified Streptomyces TaxID=2593676 RepID=UPI0016181CC4|nr:hypothetical protein [Streptomyces sp. PanSC19]